MRSPQARGALALPPRAPLRAEGHGFSLRTTTLTAKITSWLRATSGIATLFSAQHRLRSLPAALVGHACHPSHEEEVSGCKTKVLRVIRKSSLTTQNLSKEAYPQLAAVVDVNSVITLSLINLKQDLSKEAYASVKSVIRLQVLLHTRLITKGLSMQDRGSRSSRATPSAKTLGMKGAGLSHSQTDLNERSHMRDLI